MTYNVSWPSERVQAHELIAFVSDRLQTLGPDYGAAENLAAGAADLLAAYAEIFPRLDNLPPDWATGVADGLGQALRYLASAWHHHPDYRPYFAPQAPATAETWLGPGTIGSDSGWDSSPLLAEGPSSAWEASAAERRGQRRCPTPQKIKHDDEASALIAAQRQEAEFGVSFRIYCCPCGWWHTYDRKKARLKDEQRETRAERRNRSARGEPPPFAALAEERARAKRKRKRERQKSQRRRKSLAWQVPIHVWEDDGGACVYPSRYRAERDQGGD
uniref:hypothetical protein n=1 Tax=Streptomyces sp. CA-136453 TaxID=3240050 RepID=UPI003F49132B